LFNAKTGGVDMKMLLKTASVFDLLRPGGY